MEFYKKGGMTLVELLSSIIILVVMLTAMLGSYIFSMQLNELVKHKVAAVYAAKTILETMKSTPFDNILTTYPNQTKFDVLGFNGKGIIYVQSIDLRTLLVTVSFSWKESNGRVIGEDKNINGDLDAGEDLNGNFIIDSPVQIVSYILKVQ